jgi:hypothetical protein
MSIPQFAHGVHVLWRSRDEIQFGIDPNRQVRVCAKIAAHLIANCTGQITTAEIEASALRKQLNVCELQITMARLLHNGLLFSQSDAVEQSMPVNFVDNQQTELTRNRQLGIQEQRNRSNTEIEIHGAGRLGTTVALLLAHAGYVNFRIYDEQLVTISDVTAWGASRVDVGARRDHTALLIVDRIYRGTWPRMLRSQKRGTRRIVILCPDPIGDSPWFAPNLTDEVIAEDSPHIIATTGARCALVSTVLQPNKTGCLRCHNARLTDLDPSWPLLTSQLIGRPMLDLAPANLILHAGTAVVEVVNDWVASQSYDRSGLWSINWPTLAKNYIAIDTHSACGCQWNQAA